MINKSYFKVIKGAYDLPNNPLNKCINVITSVRHRKNTLEYKKCLGEFPNYISPSSWTEKMQWRKVFDRNPLFKIFCDKLKVREYVHQFQTELIFPRFIWVGETPDLIPFRKINEPYVIKPNHRSGRFIKVKNSQDIDIKKTIKTCNKWLNRPHGRHLGEWGYQGVKGRLIIEEYLGFFDKDVITLDFKFFVFSGRVKYIQVESKSGNENFLTFLDRNGEIIPLKKWIGRLAHDKMPKQLSTINIPENIGNMVDIAETVAKDLDHIRVDLYSVDEKIYFSELTPYDGSGHSYLFSERENFIEKPSQILNHEYGSCWDLPNLSVNTKIIRAITG